VFGDFAGCNVLFYIHLYVCLSVCLSVSVFFSGQINVFTKTYEYAKKKSPALFPASEMFVACLFSVRYTCRKSLNDFVNGTLLCVHSHTTITVYFVPVEHAFGLCSSGFQTFDYGPYSPQA